LPVISASRASKLLSACFSVAVAAAAFDNDRIVNGLLVLGHLGQVAAAVWVIPKPQAD
jgi:hypothetical protein